MNANFAKLLNFCNRFDRKRQSSKICSAPCFERDAMGNRKKQRGRTRKDKKAPKLPPTSSEATVTEREPKAANTGADGCVRDLWHSIMLLHAGREALLAKDHVTEDEAMNVFFLLQQTMEEGPDKWPVGLEEAQLSFSRLYSTILQSGYLPLDETTSVFIPKAQDVPKKTRWCQKVACDDVPREFHASLQDVVSGNGNDGSVDRLLSLLKEYAETKDAGAFVNMFCVHLSVPQARDLGMANECLEKAAMKGVIEAQRLLKIYEWYTDPTQSLDDAMTIFFAARRDGHATHIISHYALSVETFEDFVLAMRDPMKACGEALSTMAQTRTVLDLMKERGSALFHWILEQCDMDETWPHDSSNYTRTSFLWWVGLTYVKEGGESLDTMQQDKGIRLLRKAAELRDPNSAGTLSDIYNGDYPGIEADHEKRIYWLQKEAEWSESANHALDLANRYVQGDQVPANPKMARKWTKRAARLGDPQARTVLHQCSSPGCQNQDATGKDFKRCSTCRTTIYCSENCQRHHWKNGHKQDCRKVVEQQQQY